LIGGGGICANSGSFLNRNPCNNVAEGEIPYLASDGYKIADSIVEGGMLYNVVPT
jgi:hypothetical protein